MTELSQAILDNWQVRKTRAQKLAFIDFLKRSIPELTVEEGGFGHNRNLVVGDVKQAKVILTAHYDTCARLPIPNFITPKNMVFYLGYSLLICIPFFLLIGFLYGFLRDVTGMPLLSYYAALVLGMGAMVYLFMLGPANRHTANDNTSGVVMLTELYAAMTPEQREKTALVFFDNEENGLLGSSFFAKCHKKDGLKEKLVINYDCVSNGDYLLLVQNKPAGKRYGKALAESFVSTEEKTVCLESSAKAFYPSDQVNFPVNVGVAALNKHKLLGLYMDKIHTKHDTVFDERNIQFLTAGTLSLLDTMEG